MIQSVPDLVSRIVVITVDSHDCIFVKSSSFC